MMEEPPSRKSSMDDSYAPSLSSALLEPTAHDVMSLEMNHHEMGGYLDPSSFGGSSIGGFDDYAGQSSSLYDGYGSSSDSKYIVDHAPLSAPLPSVNSMGKLPEVQVRYEASQASTGRYEPPRNVPTYPVKTADLSTCTQYAPVRTIMTFSQMKSQHRRTSSSRVTPKKEPLDPKRVEDEVARNVSQILSATKQHRLALEAQQRNGIIPPNPARVAYACPDCHKTVTSSRNLQKDQALQRHRLSCTALNNLKKPMHLTDSMISPALISLNDPLPSLHSSIPDDHGYSDWTHHSYSAPDSVASPHESVSMMSETAMDMHHYDDRGHIPISSSMDMEEARLQPLSLEVEEEQEEPRTHSSSGSLSSSNSTNNSNQQSMYTCDSCKKSVSSFRSLKRHHTTCKPFIAEFGPPPESDRPKKTPPKKKRKSRKKRPVTSSSSEDEEEQRYEDSPPPLVSSTILEPIHEIYPMYSHQSTSSSRSSEMSYSPHLTWPNSHESMSAIDYLEGIEDGDVMPKPCGNSNTCDDCSRQLCSASNLKRHRATCKVAQQKLFNSNAANGAAPPAPPTPKPVPQWQHIDIPDKERSIIDRSYAAALAASQEARQRHQSSGANGGYLMSDPSVAQKPWITVGEHLRAQHVQQKMLEAAKSGDHMMVSPGSMLSPLGGFSDSISMMPPPLPRKNTKARSEGDETEQLDVMTFEALTYKERKEIKKEVVTPSKMKLSKDEKPIIKTEVEKPIRAPSNTAATTITPLESIITTQPLQKDRITATYANRDETERHSSEAIKTTQPTQQHVAYLQSQNHQNHNQLPPPTPTPTPKATPAAPQPPAAPPAAPTAAATTAPPPSTEFQCPECLKTYSCRKNVKRHRMAVHKLTAEEMAEGNTGPGRPPSSTRPPPGTAEVKVEPLSSPNRYTKQESWDSSWRHPREVTQDEETAETARIAAELKRSAEEEMADMMDKKPRTELAEADTTFHEEDHSGMDVKSTGSPASGASSISNGSISRGGPLPSISSWIDTKPPLLDSSRSLSSSVQSSMSSNQSTTVSPKVAQTAQHKRPPHVCADCNRVLSSDYSLRRHRLTCTEVRSNTANGIINSTESSSILVLDGSAHAATAPPSLLSQQSSDPMLTHASSGQTTHYELQSMDEWFKKEREEVPDSTTSQRKTVPEKQKIRRKKLDRSTSPCLTTAVEGELAIPYTMSTTTTNTRKRAPSAALFGEGKVAKHMCEDCGKCYSSEWNVDRHRRDNCQSKAKKLPLEAGHNSLYGDDINLLMGATRFQLSRVALTQASPYFGQLLSMHETTKGGVSEIRMQLDPTHFQSLLDVYNNPNNVTPINIDAVSDIASRLKFTGVFEMCEQYISEQLPQISVMHAIRLAENLKLTAIKQRLFDSISIDVFRSLSSDHHYKMMDAELKAELLEKWGTFL